MTTKAPVDPVDLGALTRRQFIAAALILATGRVAAAGPADPNSAPSGSLLAVLSDPAAAARFGRVFVREYPDEADVAQLEERVAVAAGVGDGPLPPRAVLTEALAARIQTEYAAAPVLRIDGWMLAPTEARLYALAALASAASAA